jgi:hypothetical protein
MRFGVLAGLAALLLVSEAMAVPREIIPIKQYQIPANRIIHYSVDVTLNGAPLEVMLDSGSTGLRVLPGAVPATAFRRMPQDSTYSYLIGVELRGAFAKTKFGIGSQTTAEDIYVHDVEKIGCTANRPECPASKVSIDKFRLGGRGIPDQGYMAIMGVGLRPAGVINPLTEIGDGAWIIDLPKPGASTPGALTLNPTAEDRAGYTMFQMKRETAGTPIGQARGWTDRLPACLVAAESKRMLCNPQSVFDTGAPGILARTKKPADRQGWTPGLAALISIPTRGEPLLSDGFVLGRQPGAGFTPVEPERGEADELLLGTIPFYSFSVLFDSRSGQIGLKKRTD